MLISSSGLDAERKILNKKSELVLLDLVLPEWDGFEILEKIRKEKDLDKTKIIIFSNLSQPEERNRAEELGADGFIVKSENTPQQIIDKVKEFAKKFEEQ